MAGEGMYKVESKDEFRKRARDGTIEKWFRIYATSKGGTYFSVEVPEAQLGKASAHLTARAQELDEIT